MSAITGGRLVAGDWWTDGNRTGKVIGGDGQIVQLRLLGAGRFDVAESTFARRWRFSAKAGSSTATLYEAGYTHRNPCDGTSGVHEIVNASGDVVAKLRAREVWAWVAEQHKRSAHDTKPEGEST